MKHSTKNGLLTMMEDIALCLLAMNISAVVHQGTTELHADATFKVVPSTPHCRQLFILHLILHNHVRYYLYL